jgi:hypothetical protein
MMITEENVGEALLWDRALRLAAVDLKRGTRWKTYRADGTVKNRKVNMTQEELDTIRLFIIQMTPFFGKTYSDYILEAESDATKSQ